MSQSDDTADARAYDEAKRRLQAGEDELIPAEFANRILNGESPVRVFRELRGLIGQELAEKVGIDIAALDQIERGEQGGREAMERIAQVLNVSVDDL